MHKIVSFVLTESSKIRKQGEAALLQASKSAPHYFEASVPTQFVVARKKAELDDKNVDINIKVYKPNVVLAEAMMYVDDIFADGILELKNRLMDICHETLKSYGGNKELSEEYTMYVVSGFDGEPEQFLKHSEKIAGLLKSEKLALDPLEIQHTLSHQIKYEKGDMTVVDWDGAFIFDANGEEVGETWELCELANYQLLKHRILDKDLDTRTEKMMGLIKKQPTKRGFLFKTEELTQSFKEIIEVRSQAVSEFESMDRDIKLIGDWYSARLYDLLSRKLRLKEWHETIKEKLDSLEDVYTIASENLGMSRMRRLESIQIWAWFILQAGWLVLIILEFIALYKK